MSVHSVPYVNGDTKGLVSSLEQNGICVEVAPSEVKGLNVVVMNTDILSSEQLAWLNNIFNIPIDIKDDYIEFRELVAFEVVKSIEEVVEELKGRLPNCDISIAINNKIRIKGVYSILVEYKELKSIDKYVEEFKEGHSMVSSF